VIDLSQTWHSLKPASLSRRVRLRRIMHSPNTWSRRPPRRRRNPTRLEKLALIALDAGQETKAPTYCDIRINRYRDQFSGWRFLATRIGEDGRSPFADDSQSFGLRIRVIVNGQWGFAASPEVTPDEIARITKEAVTVPRRNSVLQAQPVKLAPTAAYVDRWTSPFEIEPFAVPVNGEARPAARRDVHVEEESASTRRSARSASTPRTSTSPPAKGRRSSSTIVQVYPYLTAEAVDIKNGSRVAAPIRSPRWPTVGSTCRR